MKIAVEGCAHGELDTIYEALEHLEMKEGMKIDLLICCGDFQSIRNSQDLSCMAVAPKYRKMSSFYKYYSGEKVAPILTIFIGGNHEASNYLQELSYGGWVAPNIYYLGYAGVVNVGGVRIAGISGIYKGRDYMYGHFELPPYSENTKRSIYHVRNLEVFRLKQLNQPIDIMISHDWPRGISNYGDKEVLLRQKPFLSEDINNGVLGSEPATDLLFDLKPSYWFSAHLHCMFAAMVPHGPRRGHTRFLALDKCLPKRRFLQVLELEHSDPIEFMYDLEWLTIVHLTNHLLSVKKGLTYMPGHSSNERWVFTPTEPEKELILNRFGGDLMIPQNFTRTTPCYIPCESDYIPPTPVFPQLNPQTTELCEKLGVDDPLALLLEERRHTTPTSVLSPDSSRDFSGMSFSGGEASFDSDHNSSYSSNNTQYSTPPIKRLSLSLPPPKLFPEESESMGSEETSFNSTPCGKHQSISLSRRKALHFAAQKVSYVLSAEETEEDTEDSFSARFGKTSNSTPSDEQQYISLSQRKALHYAAQKISDISSEEETANSLSARLEMEKTSNSKLSDKRRSSSSSSLDECTHEESAENISLSAISNETPSSKDSQDLGIEVNLQPEESTKPAKKFKRRNQALYTDTT